MRKIIFIFSLFVFVMFGLINSSQSMQKIKEEAISAPNINLYKIENDMKQYADEVAASVESLKRMSYLITGNPDHYKMLLASMDVPNILYSIQSHLFNIFDAYGLTNELVEEHIEAAKKEAVKKASKPNDQLIKDLKHIMKFEIENADLTTSHQKLKQIKFNLEG